MIAEFILIIIIAITLTIFAACAGVVALLCHISDSIRDINKESTYSIIAIVLIFSIEFIILISIIMWVCSWPAE